MKTRFHFEAIAHDLEMDECLHMQMRERPYRVFAGLLILGIVLAAMLGWAGDGRMALQEIHRGPASVTYPGVVRMGKDFVIEIRAAQTPLAVHVPDAYLQRFRLRDVVPAPTETQVSSDGVTFRFAGQGRTAARFYLQPKQLGRPAVGLSIGDEEFRFHQLVLP